MIEPVQSLWIGDRLSALERLAIGSFLANGHRFLLYTYGSLEGVPPCARLCDAVTVLPQTRVFRYEHGAGCGSYAAFANLFRYKLLFERGGWWVDTDVVCLRTFAFERPHVFGWEDTQTVCNAIIRAPRGSVLMRDAYEIASQFDGKVEWGTTGPQLLTRLIRSRNQLGSVEPPGTFYPVHFSRVSALVTASGHIPPYSHAIHFWNEMWRRRGLEKDGKYDETSVFERLKRMYRCYMEPS